MTEPFDPDFPLQLSFTVRHTECLCGSGKKPEKCCGHQPRNYSIAMSIRNFIEAEGLALNLNDMTVERVIGKERYPLLEPARLSQSYSRSNKSDKSLVEVVLKTRGSMEPNALFLEYDHVFAIDTNTQQHQGETISLSCVIHTFVESLPENAYCLQYGPMGFFDCRNPDVPPENLGWMILSCALTENSDFKDKRIGFIVDSDKDNLDAYNKGLQPIIPAYYLPQNHTLIYASADSGNKLANKLIKKCDMGASAALREIIESNHRAGLQVTDEYPCEYFRQLDPGPNDPAWIISEERPKTK